MAPAEQSASLYDGDSTQKRSTGVPVPSDAGVVVTDPAASSSALRPNFALSQALDRTESITAALSEFENLYMIAGAATQEVYELSGPRLIEGGGAETVEGVDAGIGGAHTSLETCT